MGAALGITGLFLMIAFAGYMYALNKVRRRMMELDYNEKHIYTLTKIW